MHLSFRLLFLLSFFADNDSNNGDAAAAEKMAFFCGCGQVLSLREMFAGWVCGIFAFQIYLNGCFYLADLPFKMFLSTEPVSWFFAFNKCAW